MFTNKEVQGSVKALIFSALIGAQAWLFHFWLVRQAQLFMINTLITG